MSMTDSDINRVEGIAELKVRQYFDNYLTNILPAQFEQHAASCVHGKRFAKLVWFCGGALFAGGGGVGFTVARILGG